MRFEESKGKRYGRKLEYAKKLRRRMTLAETILWNALRHRQCAGLTFRRQVPIEWFIADFLCVEQSLIIELDGGIHLSQQQYDHEREDALKDKGLRILRFSNEQVMQNLPNVLRTIERCIK